MGKRQLQILYTPAALAERHEAGLERKRLCEEASAGGKVLGSEQLDELCCRSWLGGQEWRRGGYLTTSGLRDGAGHPELVMLNVPGAFAPHVQRLLNEVGEYVLESGARLRSGEILGLTNPKFGEMAVTFRLLAPGELSSPEFGRQMVLVLPLP